MYFSFNFAWDSIQPGFVRSGQGSGGGQGVYLMDNLKHHKHS